MKNVTGIGGIVFNAKDPGKPQPPPFSYTTLLVRHEGRLRIRLEHESTKSSAP